jgi:hypothetical protein
MTEYRYGWRNKFLTLHAKSLDDFIEVFAHELATLGRWKRQGVTLDPNSPIGDDYAEFVTTDKAFAKLDGWERS